MTNHLEEEAPSSFGALFLYLKLVGRMGIEPMTPGLKVRCRLSHTVILYLAASHSVCRLTTFMYVPSRLVPFRCLQYVGKFPYLAQISGSSLTSIHTSRCSVVIADPPRLVISG